MFSTKICLKHSQSNELIQPTIVEVTKYKPSGYVFFRQGVMMNFGLNKYNFYSG